MGMCPGACVYIITSDFTISSSSISLSLYCSRSLFYLVILAHQRVHSAQYCLSSRELNSTITLAQSILYVHCTFSNISFSLFGMVSLCIPGARLYTMLSPFASVHSTLRNKNHTYTHDTYNTIPSLKSYSEYFSLSLSLSVVNTYQNSFRFRTN